jgi:hypothetical protein
VLGGAEWFSSMGTEKSKGYTLYSLSGHVKNPGQYEAPLGITLRQLLELSGGMREGHRLKFWTPGGSSTPLLTEEHLDVPLDYEGVAAAGSMLGTKALQCFDETTCVVRASCAGPSSTPTSPAASARPCREGTYWMVQVLERLEAGTGTEEDIATLLDTCDNIFGRSFCALGDGATSPIVSGVQLFREEFLAHITQRGCPFDPVASTVFAPRGPRVTVTSPSTADTVPTDLVTLVIDGFEVAVPKGTLVIRAAELLGIQIPRFCDHPLLDPVGRVPPVHRRGGGPAQAAGLLHDHGHRGHGRQDPAHEPGRQEGAGGHPRAAAHQPPARLPGLRQGRRVPAAEPDDDERQRRVALPRRQAHLPQADRHLEPGAARPRALRAVRPLHPLQPAGRRRPVHRAVRARRAAAGRHLHRPALRELLLRQHRADLPGRRADRCGLPLPRPAVRPRVLADGVRALRLRLRAAHRPPPRQGAAPAGR